MKILQIKIHNLASLDGENTIDFTGEPLKGAGIYAITGPTGAGKSTILDALCLALYARTPRYVQAKSNGISLQDSSGESIAQGDPRSILRDGTAQGSAAVCFIGIDEDQYEATWSVRRAHQKISGKLLAYTHTLYNLTKDKEVPGTRSLIQKEIERLVGLNFEQFTRSVLLAQGDFTAFMKAGKEEKSALLERLTGSQIYSEISQNIYEHYKKEEEILKTLQNKATGIELLTGDQISEINASILNKQAQKEALQTQTALLEKAIAWHQQKALLTERMQNASTQVEAALHTIEQLADASKELERIKAVQPVRSDHGRLTEETQNLQNLHQRKEMLDLRLSALKADRQLAAEDLQKLQGQKLSREEALKAARPRLLEASNLDTKMEASAAHLQSIAQNQQGLLDIKKEKESTKNKVATLLTGALATLENLQSWSAQNQDRQKIAEETTLILSRLDQARGLLDKSRADQNAINKLTETRNVAATAVTELQHQIAATAKELESVLTMQQTLQSQLGQTSVEALDDQITGLLEAQSRLEKMQTLYEKLQRTGAEKLEVEKQLTENRRSMSELSDEVKALQPELDRLNTQLLTTQQLIEKATLRNAANTEQLRLNLIQGEPCPVCGSTSHPYAEKAHLELGDQVIQTLKEELSASKAAHAITQQQFTEKNTAIRFKENQQSILEASLQLKQAAYGEALKNWQETDYGALLQQRGVNNDEMPALIQQKATETQSALTRLQDQKKLTRSLKDKLDKGQQKIMSIKEHLQLLQNQLTELKAAATLQLQQLTHHMESLQTASTTLQELQKLLNPYFPTADWFDNWQKSPENFVSALQKFSGDWKAKQKQREELLGQTQNLKTDINGYERELTGLNLQLEQLEESLGQQGQELGALTRQRKAIFDGKAVAAVEKSLQTAIDQTAESLQSATSKVEDLEGQWIELTREASIVNHNLIRTDEQRQKLEQKIEQWIQAFNDRGQITAGFSSLDHSALARLLAYSDDWITKTEATTKAAEQELLAAKTSLTGREQDLQSHLALSTDPRPATELGTLLTGQKTLVEEVQKNILELQFRIESDQQNKQKQGALQNAIDKQQKIFNDWAALNSLIGSSDGKKFREIAQQYTLDLLLGYANQHLYVLSKRYVLSRVKGSLAIQVIDQDMADEVRSVYSLSGGESFLVSLALALGLASLSSHRLKVESLFIDEGFGSLDPTTLSIAMDALERLHNQGRKVGVISHVQEMTERIYVQIQVHKKASGKSNISIVSLV